LPALDRYEQHNLPLWGLRQILVAEYLHKRILLLPGWMELLGQRSCFLCSQRIKGTASRERTKSIDLQAPGKNSTIVGQESLWSQKQPCSITCAMSYASHT